MLELRNLLKWTLQQPGDFYALPLLTDFDRFLSAR